MSDQFETLLNDAEQSIDRLAGETEDSEFKSLLEEIEILLRVVNEAKDLLETVDLSELPEVIDKEKLIEAIDIGEIPTALRETDSEKAVKFRQLLHAVKLAKLWKTVDLQEFWQEKNELDEGINELTEREDAGVVGDALEKTMDSISNDEDGGIGEELEAGAKEAFGSAEDALKDGNLHEYQILIQQQTMAGINEFRDALIDTHGVFERLHDENRERFRRTDKRTHSRNPTAVSTMPLTRTDRGNGTRYSTVPPAVRYSTAPPLDRIYGQRFQRERENRQQDGPDENGD